MIGESSDLPGGAPTVVYILHGGCTSGQLYGAERMALDTLKAVRGACRPVLIAPPGPALAQAAALGFLGVPFAGRVALALALYNELRRNRVAAIVSTGVVQCGIAIAAARLLGRQCRHVHVVHGGSDKDLHSYGRKRWLNALQVSVVAVSEFVKQMLLNHHVTEGSICVIPNFLSSDRLHGFARRPPFTDSGIRRIAVVSRLDPLKRIDLLLDVLEAHAEFRDLEFRVYGTGPQLEILKRRAGRGALPIRFMGFAEDIDEELAECDALLHLCPAEPFGLVVIEAFAARVPVIVPDTGGTAEVVGDQRNGFLFRANDGADLARVLRQARCTPPALLNAMTQEASARLLAMYSEPASAPRYLRLLGLRAA